MEVSHKYGSVEVDGKLKRSVTFRLIITDDEAKAISQFSLWETVLVGMFPDYYKPDLFYPPREVLDSQGKPLSRHFTLRDFARGPVTYFVEGPGLGLPEGANAISRAIQQVENYLYPEGNPAAANRRKPTTLLNPSLIPTAPAAIKKRSLRGLVRSMAGICLFVGFVLLFGGSNTTHWVAGVIFLCAGFALTFFQ
jgi:hypothetical protein